MTQSFSSFDQGMDGRISEQGMMAGKSWVAFLAGGIALLIAATSGAYYLGTLRAVVPPPQAQSQAPALRPQQDPAQPAPVQPAAPQIQWQTIGTFGSWEARCTTPPGRTTQLCTAVLQVVNNQNKSVLLSWIVGPDEKGAMQTIFYTPTGVAVVSGVEVKLGNAAVRKIAFQSCGPQQCTATGPMNDAFVKEVTGADKANITVTAANGQALNFGIPVAGFGQAFAAIRK